MLKFRKKEPAEAKPKPTSTLTIYYKSGGSQSWTYHGEFKNYLTPWREFYKWYFCRLNSNSFIIRASKTETAIPRNEIIRFEVSEEAEPPKDKEIKK